MAEFVKNDLICAVINILKYVQFITCFLRMHRAACIRIGKDKDTENNTSEMIKMIVKIIVIDQLEATSIRCIEYPFAKNTTAGVHFL